MRKNPAIVMDSDYHFFNKMQLISYNVCLGEGFDCAK